VRCGGRTEAVYKSMVREASGLVQSSPSAKGEYRIARDGERGKGRSEQRTGRYLPAQNEEIRMDGWMIISGQVTVSCWVPVP